MKRQKLRLAELRQAKGLTQDYVAQMIDVGRTSVSLWETGQRNPTLENLFALASLFGVGIEDLFEEG